MAETDHQRTPLSYAIEALRHHFRDRPDVYVSGNLFIYYEDGNPHAVVAPDVFVVLGADRADRSTYRLWEEPKSPDFVLEITSRSTRREDQVNKRDLYRTLGVQEYWQFDPTSDYLKPPLQGLELVARDYRRLPARELADGALALASGVLGLDLRLTDRGLRFHDPQTGEDLPNVAESEQERQRERQARGNCRRARFQMRQQYLRSRNGIHGSGRHWCSSRTYSHAGGSPAVRLTAKSRSDSVSRMWSSMKLRSCRARLDHSRPRATESGRWACRNAAASALSAKTVRNSLSCGRRTSWSHRLGKRRRRRPRFRGDDQSCDRS